MGKYLNGNTWTEPEASFARVHTGGVYRQDVYLIP